MNTDCCIPESQQVALVSKTGLLLIVLGAMLHEQLGHAGDVLIDVGRTLSSLGGE